VCPERVEEDLVAIFAVGAGLLCWFVEENAGVELDLVSMV
jgi:hypothetical protein